MKFLQNLVNRIFNHWQSTLLGLIIAALTFMLWKKDIDVVQWGLAIGSISALKGVLLNKDPDKIENKPPPKSDP